MDSEKNINVTLKQSDNESESEIVISFSGIFNNLKKYFLIWIIFSVVAAMMASGIIMMLKTSISSSSITALVNFNYKGIEQGIDPNGDEFDVNKIKSPSVIESALTDLNLSLNYVEELRRNISIRGITSRDIADEKSLYQSIYMNSNGSSLTAAQSLLDMDDFPSYYIITLNYGQTSLDLTRSKQFLDAMLKNYQEYFFTIYGYNESLGNSIVSVDYSEYDYPTAIDVFDETLTNLSDYVTKLSNENLNFRSGKTGYSFEDLISTIETTRLTELDSIASYIEINNVTNDKAYLLNYYQYKIEEYERYQNVYRSELESISNSIDNYEKDSMVIIGDESASLENNEYTLPSKKYDELIEQKTDKQLQLSRCREQIEYYNDRLDALDKNKNKSTDANIEEANKRLDKVNDSITNLINIVNKTADEYYETVTFAHAFNILVPATGSEPRVVTNDLLLPVVVIEAVVLLGYAVFAFIKSIFDESKLKKEKQSDKESKEE
ncbi:MAG: lipopolysaccharide biosynthesis protein [Clostridium sp.]|nr:lipopolysaccharide biosynthesis protein [Clostridium sp.]MCM1546823.1 lipopolysaccharide biosynthesis protein [Ruminococcus sp.]